MVALISVIFSIQLIVINFEFDAGISVSGTSSLCRKRKSKETQKKTMVSKSCQHLISSHPFPSQHTDTQNTPTQTARPAGLPPITVPLPLPNISVVSCICVSHMQPSSIWPSLSEGI